MFYWFKNRPLTYAYQQIPVNFLISKRFAISTSKHELNGIFFIDQLLWQKIFSYLHVEQLWDKLPSSYYNYMYTFVYAFFEYWKKMRTSIFEVIETSSMKVDCVKFKIEYSFNHNRHSHRITQCPSDAHCTSIVAIKIKKIKVNKTWKSI